MFISKIGITKKLAPKKIRASNFIIENSKKDCLEFHFFANGVFANDNINDIHTLTQRSFIYDD